MTGDGAASQEAAQQEHVKGRRSVSNDEDRIIQELLADPSMWTEPDPSLENRVVAAVTAEAANGRNAAPTPSAARRTNRRVTRRPLALIAGAAAAAAVVVAVAVGAGSIGSGTSGPHLTAALAPADSGSGASGSADLTRTSAGWRVQLHTQGLPRLDNGRFYEAWMKNSAGVLVAIGTFNQGPAVTLWSGVSPKEFTTITVTAQEANGDAGSSGVRVLAGPINP